MNAPFRPKRDQIQLSIQDKSVVFVQHNLLCFVVHMDIVDCRIVKSGALSDCLFGCVAFCNIFDTQVAKLKPSVNQRKYRNKIDVK